MHPERAGQPGQFCLIDLEYIGQAKRFRHHGCREVRLAQVDVQNPQGAARIPISFSKGTSNTILIAERYGSCGIRSNIWNYWINYGDDSPGFCMTGLVRVVGLKFK